MPNLPLPADYPAIYARLQEYYQQLTPDYSTIPEEMHEYYRENCGPVPHPPGYDEATDALFAAPDIEDLLVALLMLDITDLMPVEKAALRERFQLAIQDLMDEAYGDVLDAREAACRPRLVWSQK